MRQIDISGMRFGRLLAVRPEQKEACRITKWRCLCDCGEITFVRAWHLKQGTVRSCGCLNRELLSKRPCNHGLSDSPEYNSWRKMRERCQNPNDISYKYYGAVGVKVCERWESFQNFIKDMGFKSSPHLSLDRIDPFGNYEPSNCRWADWVTQVHNRRANKVEA